MNSVKIIGVLEKIMEIHRLKKIFFFCICKIVDINRKTWEQNGVEVILFKGKKWLNQKHIEDQLGHIHLPAITNKFSSMYKKQKQRLQNSSNYQPC